MLVPRPATPDDVAFILDAFTHEYARSVYTDGLARVQVRQLLVTILSQPDWNCTVLTIEDEPTEILGFIVWRDPRHIAWLHVKGLYRHQGVARKLLTAIGAQPGAVFATFIPSPAFARSVRGKGFNLLHRPHQGLI